MLRIQPSQSHAQHVSAYRALDIFAISLKLSLDSIFGPFCSGGEIIIGSDLVWHDRSGRPRWVLYSGEKDLAWRI